MKSVVLLRLIVVFQFALLVFVCRPDSVQALMAKVTLKVVDEDAKPVEGANIRICFRGGCLKKDAIHGITDKGGKFSASGLSIDGQVGGAVEKVGYYNSTYHQDFIVSKLGMYQPWNKDIKVLLRPKLNPVPMYVRDRYVKIPFADKKIGFDLIKFDWVAPYGLGTIADLIIQVKRSWDGRDNYDSTMTMTFPINMTASRRSNWIRVGTLEWVANSGCLAMRRKAAIRIN